MRPLQEQTQKNQASRLTPKRLAGLHRNRWPDDTEIRTSQDEQATMIDIL